MSLFTVTKTEWEAAKKYFKNNPEDVKFTAKDKQNKKTHSFIQVNGEIYALANKSDKDLADGHVLGEGSFGRVKIGQNEKGEAFAVKIEGHAEKPKEENTSNKSKTKREIRLEKKLRRLNKSESDINTELGRSFGQALRELPTVKQVKIVKKATHKKYSIQKKLPGKNLKDILKDAKPVTDSYGNTTTKAPLTDTQKLLVAMHLTKEIRMLHKKNILHRDIKPENFMVDINGYNVTANAIDFGLSAKLKFTLFGKKVGSIFGLGSPYFMAPEIKHSNNDSDLKNVTKNVYSKSSDIYALGLTLQSKLSGMGLEEPKNILEKMQKDNPDHRPILSDVLNGLYKTISAKPDFEQAIPSVALAIYESSPGRFKSVERIESVIRLKHEFETTSQQVMSQIDKNHPEYTNLKEKIAKVKDMNILKYEDKHLSIIQNASEFLNKKFKEQIESNNISKSENSPKDVKPENSNVKSQVDNLEAVKELEKSSKHVDVNDVLVQKSKSPILFSGSLQKKSDLTSEKNLKEEKSKILDQESTSNISSKRLR